MFNGEGAGGSDPGVIHFEATSKKIKIQLALGDVRHIYDISLDCAVPFRRERSTGPGGEASTTFQTMIEPSMGRMFAIATSDNSIRKYTGNRKHGLSDADLKRRVAKLITDERAPEHVVINPREVRRFLAMRGPKGITISAESPTHLPAARRLAAFLRETFGWRVRITRNSPRIGGLAPTFLEQPDILLGSHNDSHYIAMQRIQMGHANHTMRLPIMTSHTFPGPGRSVITLLRPFVKYADGGNQGKALTESFASPKLVVGASDTKGLEAGIENLIELAAKLKKGK